MKKIYYGALALLLMAGCTNDDLSVQPESVKSISKINAVIEKSPDTRAHFENELKVVWDEGDDIAVMTDMEDQARLFTYEPDETTGVFIGRSMKMDKELYGFYPGYNLYPTYNVAEKIANVRAYGLYHHEGEFAGSVPMAGKSQTDNITFKQVVGIVKISLKGTSYITNLTFSSNAGEKLSGNGYVDLKADDPKLVIDQEDSENNSAIYMESWVQLNKDVATDFYFQVPPMTLSEGFTLVIEGYDEDDNRFRVEKKSSTPLTIKRGYLKAYSCFDTDEEIEAQEEAARQAEARTREILKLFYDALDGDNWYNNDNWNTDAPLSEWYGLRIENGILTGINLWNNNLQGEVPEEIGELTTLRFIELVEDDNNITFPETMGNLTNLNSLWLGGIHFDTFPTWISQLKNLEQLSLQNGSIEGNLPEELKELTKLRILHLFGNQFSGELPDWMGNLTNLENLDLNNNEFTGMIPDSWFTNLKALRYLNLNDNNLSGVITTELQESPMWQNLIDKYINPQKYGYGIEIKGFVTEITLNQTELTLRPGETFQLEVTAVLPDDALNKDTYWEEDDWYRQFATIDDNGLVTAVAPGDVWIYCGAADNNGAYATCHVRVVASRTEGNTETYTGTGSKDKWEQ